MKLISCEEAANVYKKSIDIDPFILAFNNAVKTGNDVSLIISNPLQRKIFTKMLSDNGWKYDIINGFTVRVYVQSSIMDKINEN